MTVGRTFIALLIALSVALLPATGGAAPGMKQQDVQQQDVQQQDMQQQEMSASMATYDCCVQAPMMCLKMIGDCQSMASCGFSCVNSPALEFSGIAFSSVLSMKILPFGSDTFRGQSNDPPSPPPRA